MSYIVIAMPRREDAVRLKQMVNRSGLWEDICICTSGTEILQTVEEKDVVLLITTKLLKDMGCEELSVNLPPMLPMILLAKNPSDLPFSSNITPLEIPFRMEKLTLLLRRLLPNQPEVRKKRKPVRSAREQKLIDDAKALLMEQKDLSEPDAFRYLQKNSMDTGKTLVETAQMILLFGK